MMSGKSIITDKLIAFRTPPAPSSPRVGWWVSRFDALIQAQGYDAFIDHAQRCPCADKNSGQALSTCRNCLGRGWIFIDRTETRVIAQRMDSKKKYEEWSEVNRGTASITTRGVNKLGFMDRVILTQLQEEYTEILKPIMFDGELIAYPVYEPLSVQNMYLFASDNVKLVPLGSDDYTIDGNRIVFNQSILNHVNPASFNVTEMPLSISVRYLHYPVYHVIDINRELMRVREARPCGGVNDGALTQMPINVTARKAHFIFDAQKWGAEAFDNTVNPKEVVILPPYARFSYARLTPDTIIFYDRSMDYDSVHWTIPESDVISLYQIDNSVKVRFLKSGEFTITLTAKREGFPDSVYSEVVRINLLNI